MTVWPVIVRELRAESRRPFTAWLRVIGAGALLLAAAFSGEDGMGRAGGEDLFGILHGVLLMAIWVVVPLVTADCISRERRENTLGLLLLTPLRAGDIVIAKSLVQALRALTAWVAALPILVLPFLMGGVSWADALMVMLILCSSFTLALAAGMLASACARIFHRALLLAGTLALLLYVGLALAAGWATVRLFPSLTGSAQRMVEIGLSEYLRIGTVVLNHPGSALFSGPATANWIKALGMTAGISLIGLLGVVMMAARIVRRTWQAKHEATWQRRIRAWLCAPLPRWTGYRGWLQRRLEQNPIAWLEHRTWQGRTVVWSWQALILPWWGLALFPGTFYTAGFGSIERVMGFTLLLSMGITAAISFWRDRERGTLELLLVTPMSERRVIWGRLWGIWRRFLPALLLFFGLWIFVILFRSQRGTPLPTLAYFVSLSLTLPLVGLYFSLRCRNLLLSVGLTLLVGVGAPKLAILGLQMFQTAPMFWLTLAVEVLLVSLCLLTIRWKRKRRLMVSLLALLGAGWFLTAVVPGVVGGTLTLPQGRFNLGRALYWMFEEDVWRYRKAMWPVEIRTYGVIALQWVIALLLAWRTHRAMITRNFGLLCLGGG